MELEVDICMVLIKIMVIVQSKLLYLINHSHIYKNVVKQDK